MIPKQVFDAVTDGSSVIARCVVISLAVVFLIGVGLGVLL